MGPPEVEFVRGRYDEEILYQDRQIGRLLEALERRGLRERTLIVVVSDHGEEMHEHGGWDHGGRMWQELIRVPFLLWAPPSLRPELAPPPHRIAQPVSLSDVMPTVLDLLGLPVPADVQGRSRLPELRGGRKDEPVYVQENDELGALVDGPWKLVYRPGSAGTAYSLYHLGEDPGEQQDLAAERPEQIERMRALLEETELALGGRRVRSEDSGPEKFDDDELEELRALGYVEDE